jgi:hypothetical protein
VKQLKDELKNMAKMLFAVATGCLLGWLSTFIGISVPSSDGGMNVIWPIHTVENGVNRIDLSVPLLVLMFCGILILISNLIKSFEESQ